MSWHILKDCESLPCLQEQEEVSSEAICWDGERFAPSSGPTILGGYCLPASETESCLGSRSGMMCRPSTATHGEGESMSSLAGSHARTSAQPGKAQESMGQGLECGSTWPGSFARFDPDSCSWRTPQCSLLAGLDEFSATWPRWGMMRSGACWELSTLAPRTEEIESGLLPTPLASIATHGGPNQRDSSGRPGLQMAAMMWPTPRAGNPGSRPNGKGGRILAEEVAIAEGLRERGKSKHFPTPRAGDGEKRGNFDLKSPRNGLPAAAKQSDPTGGQLNPDWVEWLMGWLIGWTDSKPLETVKFQQWQQQHSGF